MRKRKPAICQECGQPIGYKDPCNNPECPTNTAPPKRHAAMPDTIHCYFEATGNVSNPSGMARTADKHLEHIA